MLDADGRRFGLVVDGLADPEEIVVKPLSPVLKKIGLYSGATVLGNAELALILDPGAIAGGGSGDGQRRTTPPATCEADGADDRARPSTCWWRWRDGQAAVPLAIVLRIEQIPMSRIE